MSLCLCCLISGRVQGVWFRVSTREQASRLGISGYARNLSDGRVEVLACGEQGALDTLEAWLWQGPSGARVEHVECSSSDIERVPASFTTG